MKEICAHEECTGCTACSSICGKSAISFKPDALGFLYPEIDQEKCVNCGLCSRTCPNNSSVLKAIPQDSFVGYANDSEEQLTSSSGGIASAISRWIIKNDGVVFGCYAESIDNISHIRVDKEEDLVKLKGSKYVQSDMRNCYSLVRKDVLNNKKVLFIGTPCQVAGLKSFLRKEYQNLITMDFVCHGVPSQRILKESLKSKALDFGHRDYNVSFRRKTRKGKKYISSYGLFVKDQKDHKNYNYIYEGLYPKDMYITGFLSALFYRNSCYQCHYTTPERVSDITVGDYGDSDEEYNFMEGKKLLLSMITVNTSKGKSVLDKMQGILNVAHIDYAKLVAEQGQLRQPMKRHKHRDIFETNFLCQDFNALVKSLLQKDLRRIKKITRMAQLRRILFYIPFLKCILQKGKNK